MTANVQLSSYVNTVVRLHTLEICAHIQQSFVILIHRAGSCMQSCDSADPQPHAACVCVWMMFGRCTIGPGAVSVKDFLGSDLYNSYLPGKGDTMMVHSFGQCMNLVIVVRCMGRGLFFAGLHTLHHGLFCALKAE